MTFNPVPKPEKPFRDPEYLLWIKRLPCLVHGRRCEGGRAGACDAHHVLGGGVGRKGPDNVAVPLCHRLHIGELHGQGRATFEERYEVDLEEAAAAIRAKYLRMYPDRPRARDEPEPGI